MSCFFICKGKIIFSVLVFFEFDSDKDFINSVDEFDIVVLFKKY